MVRRPPAAPRTRSRQRQALEMTWGTESCVANVKDGYVEGLLRGYRSGFLTPADYSNLAQCENLDDVKLHLVRLRVARARAARAAASEALLNCPPPLRELARLCSQLRAPGLHRLRAVPGERAFAAGASHHSGEVHSEAGRGMEPPALPGARPRPARAAARARARTPRARARAPRALPLPRPWRTLG